MTVRIIYFSGTGCTRHVAKTCRKELLARGHIVQFQEIRNDVPDIREPYDFLIVCFVVHACNAPRPIMDWVARQKPVDTIPTAILSVSGGGEVTPNLASRVSLKKKLMKKNFTVFYEKMITMPSNWIIATKPILAKKLIEILPGKLAFAIEEMLSGIDKKVSPGIGNRFLSFLGKLEQYGTKKFGKGIQVLDACNGCSLCARGCPTDNIHMFDNRPVFDDACVLCLNCLYGCPQKALVPRYGKFVVIKEGFNIDTIINDNSPSIDFDIQAETRGLLWLGVRRYLCNTKDMLVPSYHGSSLPNQNN